MDKLKYIKLENEDGSYSSSIPLAVDSDYVDVNGTTLTNELSNKANIVNVNFSINNLQNQINGLASGAPLVASSIADMTDTTRVYVNTTDGNWYYYDTTSSQWLAGGIYQSSGIDPNNEEIYKKLDKQVFYEDMEISIESGVIQTNGTVYQGDLYNHSIVNNVSGKYKVTCWSVNSQYLGCFVKKTGKSDLILLNGTAVLFVDEDITIPEEYEGGTLYLNGRTDMDQINVKQPVFQNSEDFYEDFNNLKENFNNLKENITTLNTGNLCARKTEDNIYIFKHQYSKNKDLCIQIGKKQMNNLFDFKSFIKCNNNTNIVLNTLPDTSQRVGIVGGETDFISPSIIYARNNIDGDFPSFDDWKFTGGWHGYNNANTGVTPTARNISTKVYVDNEEVINDNYKIGKNIKVIIIQNLQGSNTEKQDGTGREIMQQKIEISINENSNEIKVYSELKALEDIIIARHYGLSCYRANNNDICYLIGSRNRRTSFTYNENQILSDLYTTGVEENVNSTNDKFEMYKNSILDLGSGYANKMNYGLLISGLKAYLQFINCQSPIDDGLYLNTNEIVRWEAYYNIYSILT